MEDKKRLLEEIILTDEEEITEATIEELSNNRGDGED